MKKIKNKRRQHDAPTIADVAKIAGVSPMTVSRVINTEGNVRPETADKVNEAIGKLGYIPNQAARNLAGANAIHIGVLYSNPSAAYLSEFLVGAMDQARIRDIQLVVEKSDNVEDAVASAQRLITGGINGIMLPPPLSDSSPLLRLLEQTDTPTVVIGSSLRLNNVSVVSIDDHQAAFEMTTHLIRMGHERIAFIIGDPGQVVSRLRLSGFRAAMNDAGLDVNENFIIQGDFSYRSGMQAAEKLLGQNPRPTAIFASNDDMAAASVAVAHRNRIEVPDELTVVGFDDTALATTMWPELTTIHQPINDMSRTAVDFLTQKIRARRDHDPEESQHIMLDFTLVRRQSDAPPEKENSGE